MNCIFINELLLTRPKMHPSLLSRMHTTFSQRPRYCCSTTQTCAYSLVSEGTDSFFTFQHFCKYLIAIQSDLSFCFVLGNRSNYNFAKFCWKTLVVDQLNDAYGSGGNTFENVLSRWVLDKDSRSSIDSGVINRFLMHVDNLSKINRESQEKRMGRPDLQFQFQLSVVAVIDSAVFGFGSAHTFTDPLVETRFSSVNLSASALLSQSGWFVPERATTCPSPVKNNRPERDAQVECEGGNEFNFRSTFSVMYLNTRHE